MAEELRLTLKLSWEPPSAGRAWASPVAPSIVREETWRLLLGLQAVAVRVAVEEAPIDRGGLRRSLFPGAAALKPPPKTGEMVVEVGSNLIYAGPQEDADFYTQRKVWFPPIDPIAAWVWRKRGAFGGIETKAQAARLAFVICRSLAKKGIRPKQFLKAGFTAAQVEADPLTAAAAERIVRRLEG